MDISFQVQGGWMDILHQGEGGRIYYTRYKVAGWIYYIREKVDGYIIPGTRLDISYQVQNGRKFIQVQGDRKLNQGGWTQCILKFILWVEI